MERYTDELSSVANQVAKLQCFQVLKTACRTEMLFAAVQGSVRCPDL